VQQAPSGAACHLWIFAPPQRLFSANSSLLMTGSSSLHFLPSPHPYFPPVGGEAALWMRRRNCHAFEHLGAQPNGMKTRVGGWHWIYHREESYMGELDVVRISMVVVETVDSSYIHAPSCVTSRHRMYESHLYVGNGDHEKICCSRENFAGQVWLNLGKIEMMSWQLPIIGVSNSNPLYGSAS